LGPLGNGWCGLDNPNSPPDPRTNPPNLCKICKNGVCEPANEGAACRPGIEEDPCKKRCESGVCKLGSADVGKPCGIDTSPPKTYKETHCKICKANGVCENNNDYAACGPDFDSSCTTCQEGVCLKGDLDTKPCGPLGESLYCKQCRSGKCENALGKNGDGICKKDGSICKLCLNGECAPPPNSNNLVCYPNNPNPCQKRCMDGECISGSQEGLSCTLDGCKKCNAAGACLSVPNGGKCDLTDPLCSSCQNGKCDTKSYDGKICAGQLCDLLACKFGFCIDPVGCA
jgi:hypothetical protein